MSWNEIASNLLKSNSAYDNIQLSFPENAVNVYLPKILKLTLKLIEDALVKGINKIIIVYPEKIYLPSLTVIFQSFSNISSGNSDNNKDFDSLQNGQRLKIDNYVCEYISSNKERIWVKWADINNSFLKSNFPAFQKAETKRKLSKYPGLLINNIGGLSIENKKFSIINMLKQNLSFQTKSIIYVTSENKFAKTTYDLKFDNLNIMDLLLFGKIKIDNTIDIINKGQIHGVPAILFNYDIDQLHSEHVENASLIFIDYSDNLVNTKLPSLDKYIKTNIPIIILTDTINSFNMTDLENRGFQTLRWDRESIIPDLINEKSDNVIDYKVFNCHNCKINYELCESHDISMIVKTMINIRKVIENSNQNIIDLYWQLYEIAILSLRNIIVFSSSYKDIISTKINNIRNGFMKYKYSISTEIIGNIEEIVSVLYELLKETYLFAKTKKVKELIQSSSSDNIVIIIPENDDKNTYNSYWNLFLEESDVKKKIDTMYPQEYSAYPQDINAEVIVCGWLGKNRMKNIIYSNNASYVYILLYKIEEKWKKYHLAEWEEIIKNESRRNFDKLFTSIEFQTNKSTENNDIEINEDIDNVEISIRENRYKKYSQNMGNLAVETIPITFVSGYFSFYKKSSNIITVTDIINNISDNSKSKITTDIQVGDFIVIRETERSLIRELADAILIKEGKNEYREKSARWKNKLNEKRKFCSIKELYEKIISEGANIGIQAFRAWVDDDDFIAPQDKENLLYISAALNDNYLINNIDEIWEICKHVRKAHVKAGNEVSNKLKNGIAKSLSKITEIRKNEIWDPIDLQLDELGKVKILKVISIGGPIDVDIIYTNRLLTESPRDKYNIEGRSTREVFMEYSLGLGDCKAKGFIPDENKIYRRIK